MSRKLCSYSNGTTPIEWPQEKDRKDCNPMVVFVRLAKNEEDNFSRSLFIIKFITWPCVKELATPTPDELIEQLRFLLERSASPLLFAIILELLIS